MFATATRPVAAENFHGLIHNQSTSAFHRWVSSTRSVPLKLVEQVSSPPPSLPSYHQVPHEENGPSSSKIKRRRLGDKAVTKFMESRLVPIDPKPVAQFDRSKQVVSQFECTTCNKFFPSHPALEGHRSSHYVRDKNNLKQGNHECEVCHKCFSTGQALGGHKRSHYDGPLILKRKAPSDATCLMSATQEIPQQSPTVCLRLFSEESNLLRDGQENSQSLSGCMEVLGRYRPNQFTEDEEINLELTLWMAY